jgi:DNA-binding transcriptional ArsR family regulator
MEPTGQVEDAARQLDATFLALADPTRRAILARLALGEASVMELAAPFTMSQPAISKHLKVLERAGLVRVGQDAQRRPRRLDGDALQAAGLWIEKCRAQWEENYQRLDRLLAELQQGDRRESAPARKATPRSRRG